MRAALAFGVIAAIGGTARADDPSVQTRAPVLDFEGAGGIVIPDNLYMADGTVQPAGVGIVRALVSWERGPVPMPLESGTAAGRFDIGPELGLGFIGNDKRGDMMAQAGLRLHVAFAQNGMGLFHISARGGIWLAARAGIVGGEHNTMIEGDLGWYMWLGRSWRIGWEMGFIGVRNPTDATGTTMPLYDSQPDGVTKILNVALFVGKTL
jgi:hypothetical protein